MRLSKVELFGFKSFADKTQFDLDSGITAVLGPNGCGKSNVVDAIKWVLGEQRAKSLRGAEMTDVIFAGSEARKPMGMAEVSLYFDNSDGLLPTEYNEVCITRRLYRSGESEYLINRNPCRLRDIRELFMDTGVGTSAYSFIEQGKVEALLAAKPQERRMVFEEAAGVSKYKVRRKETLNRLDRMQQHLARVNDIVDEVDKRIRSVSRQASNARRYQRLTEELRDARGKLYALQWREAHNLLDDLGRKQAELDQLRVEEDGRAGVLSTVMGELEARALELEAAISDIDRSNQGLSEELTTLESGKARVSERIHFLRKEAENARIEAQTLRTRLQNIDTERENLTSQRDALCAEAAALDGELDAASRAHQENLVAIGTTEAELTEARANLTGLQNRRNEISASIARVESETEQLTARKADLEARRHSVTDTETSLRDLVDTLEKELTLLTEEEARLRESLTLNEKQVEASRAAIDEATTKVSARESRHSSLQGRLSTLQELEASMAGFFPGVRAAMQAKKDGKRECQDIEGVVADVMIVPPEYALAIETVLGAQQQSIITRTATGARDAISFLKRERAGRATFLPLDRIQRHSPVKEHILRLPGVVGEAVELVDFDDLYEPAMENLLAGVLVVQTLDHAIKLGEREARGIRMVTLEGDLINPSGAMTGGQDGRQKAGLISRKSEMDDIQAELDQMADEIQTLTQQRQAAADRLIAAGSAQRELTEKLRLLSAACQDKRTEYTARKTEYDRIALDTGGMDEELARIDARLAELGVSAASISTERSTFDENEGMYSSVIATNTARLETLRAAAVETSEALTALRIRCAQATEKREHTASRLASLDQDVDERLAQATRCDERAEHADSERVTLEKEEAELTAQIGEALSRRGSVEEGSREARSELGIIRTQLHEKQEEERTSQRRIAKIIEGLNNLKIQERESTLRLESIAEKAKEELDVEDMTSFVTEVEALAAEEAALDAESEAAFADDASDSEHSEDGDERDSADENEKTPEEATEQGVLFDREALTAAVRELTDKLTKLGPVNMCAIEELAELEARNEFITSQRDDLDHARKDLESVLNRLNGECSKRFTETFETVRGNFQIMFQRLFGGGKADLVLEAAEDAFDAGIDIIARPPGKEPTSISLLSGGEKALCAVALLLAIFRSKPSPFCILDEVDGPLDESNIDRFMDAVREFSQESQFILISHSKRTMSMVDTIYGVTQQEAGVSTKRSLRFAGIEEDIAEEASVA